jgi:hypothetical protein
MDKGDTSLRKATKYWNILATSLSNRLNGITRCKKVGRQGMLIEHEDEVMVTKVLNMQNARLFIDIQQLKMKVAKFTQTRPTPFQNGVPRNS